MQWYSVLTYSGEESYVEKAIRKRAKFEEMDHLIGDIVVAKMTETKIVGGKRTSEEKARFPGYLFIQAQMSPDLRILIDETPRVQGIVGGNNPTVVSEKEMENVKGVGDFMVVEKLNVGTRVKVTDGPFAGFFGVIAREQSKKQVVVVYVEIFGRSTPIEIDRKKVIIDCGKE